MNQTNIRFRLSVFFSLVSLLFLSEAAWSQNFEYARIKQRIDRVNLNNIDQLNEMVDDPNMHPDFKALAIERIGELQRQMDANRDASSLIAIINKATKHKGKAYDKLRQKSCASYGMLADQPGSENAIEPMKDLLMTDASISVRQACAVALGKYRKHSTKATAALIEGLKRQLEIQDPDRDSIDMARAIIKSLGNLRNKASFIILMRVLQSKYPNSIKNEAHRALEKIRWD